MSNEESHELSFIVSLYCLFTFITVILLLCLSSFI
jgi:hypothetical protein